MIRNSFTPTFVPIINIIIVKIYGWQLLVMTKVASIPKDCYEIGDASAFSWRK